MKELTKEEVLKLPMGTNYVTYNPFTGSYNVEWASDKDIAHHKYVIAKLRYFIVED